MPRGQPAAKRQQGVANQRDTRHENGLVGPGKRVQKQKSNGHLNGHANRDNHPPTPPLPATPPHSNGHARNPYAADAAADSRMSSEALRRASLSAYSESSSSDYNTSAIPGSQENHRRIDVNSAKNPAVHQDLGPLNLALTVLRSCPLYDTIAILIVLLQLPPTFLSLVHLLFATLTFVPPSANATSGLSFSDIFEGGMGTPSVATIIVVDLFVLMIWLFLWGSLQDIALDLAQTVIALTLGGGTSGREAGMNNVLVCFCIVGFSHLVRNGNIKQFGLRAFLSSSTGIVGSPDPDDPMERAAQTRSKKGAHGWVRSILAIHILAQGLVRYVRDWYVRREKQVNSASFGDPEAGKALADANNDSTSHTQTPDNDSSTSLPVSSTAINSKKKRKQSAQVRIRQPLWAALASTKIVMVKEYETSHTAAESAGTNATDINNLGNAPFNTEADRIWITYVGSGEVHFSTSYFPTHTSPEECEARHSDSTETDKSKPFFVRINQTRWLPTRINHIVDPEQPAGQDMRWSGEITGLTPAASYECEFVSTIDNTIIFSTSVRTRQTPTADTNGALSPSSPNSDRPGSPTATLRKSIQASEIKLHEERNHRQREKKEQRVKLSLVRKDLSTVVTSLSTAGSSDERLKQKIQQSNLHSKQAEDAINTLDESIKAFDNLPTHDASLYASAKSAFQAQREANKKFRAEINSEKQAADSSVTSLKNELATINQKCERLQNRIAKHDAEFERIVEANNKGIDEAERKANARAECLQTRSNTELMFMDRSNSLSAKIEHANATYVMLCNSIAAMEQAGMYSTGLTDSPSASMQNLNAAASPFTASSTIVPDAVPAFPWTAAGPSMAYDGYNASMGGGQGFRTRGRSSSMLSNVSGFTQSSDEGVLAPSMPHIATADWGDEGSGSGSASRSGSGRGSVGDPKSPIENGKAPKW